MGTQWVQVTVKADAKPVVEVDSSVKNKPVEASKGQIIDLTRFVKVEDYPKDATLHFYTDKNNKNTEIKSPKTYEVKSGVTIFVQAEYTVPNENARLRSSGTTVLSDFVTFDIGVQSTNTLDGTATLFGSSTSNTNVPRSGTITLTFNQAISFNTLNDLSNNITLNNGGTCTAAPHPSNNTKVIVTYSGLSANQAYTLSIPVTAVTNLSGAETVSFTTTSSSNQVNSNSFGSIWNNAPASGKMVLTFQSNIAAGALGDITLVRTSNNNAVSGFSASVSGNQLIITINNNALTRGQQYRLTVPVSAVPALASAYTFDFTPTTSTNQVNSTSLDGIRNNAPVNRDITFTLANNISAGVLNDIALVKVANNNTETPVTISSSVSGRTLTIRYNGSLEYNTSYKLTVPTTAVPGLNGDTILNFTTAMTDNQVSGNGTLKYVSRNVEVESSNGVKFVSEFGYLEDDDGIVDIQTTNGAADLVPPGEVMYYPLLKPSFTGSLTYDDIVSKSDAVKSAKASASNYQLGKSEIASIKIQYKKFSINGGSGRYGYFLAITTRETTSTSAKDFAADITLKKSSGTDSSDGGASYAFEYKVNAAFAVQYPTTFDFNVLNKYQIFDLRDVEDEQTFDFDKISGAYFEVEVNSQNRMLIKADAKYNSTVASKYPNANIDFFNGYGANFNRIGELHIPAEPGTHIYVIESDSRLSKVSNATYDSGEECWVIKTRTLAHYAISDRELDVSSSSSTAPSTAPEQPSPAPSSQPAGTGGIPTVKPNPGTGVKA